MDEYESAPLLLEALERLVAAVPAEMDTELGRALDDAEQVIAMVKG
jgi:hypothetical protein